MLLKLNKTITRILALMIMSIGFYSCNSNENVEEIIDFSQYDVNNVGGEMNLSRNIYLSDIASNSVTLEWNKPSVVTSEAVKYIIYLDGKAIEEIDIDYSSYESNYHSYRCKNLTQGESYNVQIVCIVNKVIIVTQYIVIHCNPDGITELPVIPTDIIDIFTNLTSDLFVFDSDCLCFNLSLEIPQINFPGCTITIIDDGLKVLSNIAAGGPEGAVAELQQLSAGGVYSCTLQIKLASGYCLELGFPVIVPPCPIC